MQTDHKELHKYLPSRTANNSFHNTKHLNLTNNYRLHPIDKCITIHECTNITVVDTNHGNKLVTNNIRL